MKRVKLNKASRDAIDNFGSAAQTWGWISDQGVGAKVNRTGINYIESLAALEKRIMYLERTAARLRKERKSV